MKICLLVLSILTSVSALSADIPKTSVRVHITPARQDSSPLQVLGWYPNPSFAKGPTAVVKNVSEKAITGFILATRATVPRDCPQVTQSTDHWDLSEGHRLQKVMLSPGQMTTSPQNLLSPSYMLSNVPELGSRDFEVHLYVVSVSFADGTSWKISNFREPLAEDVARGCAGRAAFWADPMSEVRLHFTDAQLHPAAGQPSDEILKEWTLQCKTTGLTADCE